MKPIQKMRKKILLLQIFFIPIIIFFVVFASETIKNANKDYSNLNFVKGKVTKIDSIKYTGMPNKNGIRKTQTIFLFEIENNKPTFGIIDDNTIYKSSRKNISNNKNSFVELYYDKSGEEILNGITLHIFELKINNILERSLKQEQKKHMNFSLILFFIAIGFITVDILIIKTILKKYRN